MARVLIVDDSHDTTDTCATLLTFWGHETRKAYDGESVLQQALAFGPDVVLLDLGLPGIDGYEVLKRLRKFPILAKTKIVAVSGFANSSDVDKCLESGFDAHFAKPVETEDLKLFLDSLVQ